MGELRSQIAIRLGWDHELVKSYVLHLNKAKIYSYNSSFKNNKKVLQDLVKLLNEDDWCDIRNQVFEEEQAVESNDKQTPTFNWNVRNSS